MRALMPWLLLAALWTSSADACAVGYGQLFYGTETITTMSAESGKDCIVLTHSQDVATVTSVRISHQAKNGIADIKDGSSWRYRSRPGFKGPDEFAVAICSTRYDRKGCATVRVKVTVY